jgi:hypothetical protein
MHDRHDVFPGKETHMIRTVTRWTQAAFVAALLSTSLAQAAPHAARARIARDGWPDTPAGVMARKWVKAFSKGERAMRACLEENLAAESLGQRGIAARLESYRGLRERLGDLMLVRVVASAPDSVVAALATSEMTEKEFTFQVQARPPHKLLRVSLKETRSGHGGHGGGIHH